MEEIKMVDLENQHQKIRQELDEAISNVITESAFINGPQVKSFARSLENYLNTNHVIPCGNGTDALQIALMALELPEGSEVLVPAFNYVATAEVIALLGLKPVFVDVDEETFNMDPEDLKKKISKASRVIMPVHLFGQCADMDAIMKIAREHQCYVVEDAAQAIGSMYSSQEGWTACAGTIGDIGTTSFFPSKNLGAMGDGGAVFTNNDELAEKLRIIPNHGQKAKYQYDEIGINSRLDTLQAAILEVKLNYLPEYIEARQQAASWYDSELQAINGITAPQRQRKSTHVFHQYTIKFEKNDRDHIKDQLKEQGIPSMVYYPYPLHLQKAYKYLGYNKGDLPVSEKLCKKVLSLPMHTELTQNDIEAVTSILQESL